MFLKRFFNSPSTLASGVKDKIKEAIKSALLAKDSPRVGTLKLLQADIINFEKSGADIKGESDYLQALQSVKDRFVTTIESYKEMINKSVKPVESAKLSELLEKETKELHILQSFLPTPYSLEEIKQILEAGKVDCTSFQESMKFIKNRVDYTRIGKAELSRLLRKLNE